MSPRLSRLLAVLFTLPLATACAQNIHRPSGTLTSFRSDAELTRYMRQLIDSQRLSRRRGAACSGCAMSDVATGNAPPMAASAVAAPTQAARAAADESVTNTQHAGVDEGGIVKLHGDYLVMLRRGRLFTVSIADRSMQPIAAENAFGPGIDPRGTWYDELIVSGEKVVVIGYSYQRGGTELGTFRIDRVGGLHYLGTYHLRSNDYYSSRNYASRLVDGKLVFYTPLYLGYGTNPIDAMPSMRKWERDSTARGFTRIVSARHVYMPARPMDAWSPITLHTVTTCDLSTRELECDANVVIGPAGRVFYVSPTAVYVWVNGATNRTFVRENSDVASAVLYRMPLDGSAPSALGVSGGPIDQFSFLEGEDGYLNVLVRAESGGDAMWRVRRSSGAVALLRTPIESFDDGRGVVPSQRYMSLPSPIGGELQNRFVGHHLLYGTGNGWGRPSSDRAELYVVGLEDGRVASLELSHAADRIEAMGSDAVVIGASNTDLHFSGIRLGARPEIVQRFTLPGASQGETRSHGFFYKPDGAQGGVIGLPVSAAGRPGYAQLRQGSASVLFLRNEGRRFEELGSLWASERAEQSDACVASCVDWYGNARPLFARGRVFALLGYELVEGAISGNGIREVDRVSFAPRRVLMSER